MGGYSGLNPGQTFYFSRTFEQELDSPTLQISPVNRNFSVFLDETLIYTDCPDADNRIGYLTLPMKEWDEPEPLTISLPAGHQGKVLTIAQSFPAEYTEASSATAYPTDVYLYCGYSYESELIAESFLTAGALFTFFCSKAGRCRHLLYGLTIVYAITVFMRPFVSPQNRITILNGILQDWIAFFIIITVLVLSGLFWRKENRFYRLFTPLVFFGLPVYWCAAFIANKETGAKIALSLQNGQISYLYRQSFPVITCITLIVAIVNLIQYEANRHTEKRLLKQQNELTVAGYENLRRHQEEVMMLRHDMNRHFHILQNMSTDDKITAYLSELIGQNEKIRPVVQSGNEILDIILNGKLSAAIDKGVQVDISKLELPRELPLSDADLCSLIMNMIDNAVTAAVRSRSKPPFIRLDIHVKGNYLAIHCENTANIEKIQQESQKETVPKHGLGLKIIHGIVKKYGGMIDTEYGEDFYELRIALPLG